MLKWREKNIGKGQAMLGVVVLMLVSEVAARENVFAHFGHCMNGRACQDTTKQECCKFDNQRDIDDAAFCMTKE